VLVYSRELDIVNFGDGTTRDALARDTETCVCVLPPAAYKDWGTVVARFEAAELIVKRVRTLYLDGNTASDVGRVCGADGRALEGAVSLLCIMGGLDGVKKMQSLCAAAVGELGIAAPLVATTAAEAADLVSICSPAPSTATLDSCTCCVVKPHAIKTGALGAILDGIIQQGYEVSAMDTFQFDKAQADEFLEVYKDVVPQYADHVVQLCSGLCVGMELRAENAVETFRQTVGPWDVEMAKELRPATLRAKHAVDNVRCGVHCTDLPTDGPVECEYLFKILS
jgi:nucleoside-diphosphate kinase